ncbi:MAG: retropepsin-like aspartic protease family protein [Caulobacteraceae bacterium]
MTPILRRMLSLADNRETMLDHPGGERMADFEGPWGGPRPPGPPRPRRRLGLLLWIATLLGALAAFFALTELFPGQLTRMDWADALYLFGLLALVSSGLLAAQRIRLGETARNLAVWLAVFALALIGYSFRGELAAAALRARSALIPAYAVQTSPRSVVVSRSEDGSFYIIGQVDGIPVRFLIDTGASEIVLSPADAQRLGLDLASIRFSAASETANGVGHGAPFIMRSLAVGPIRLADVPAEINQRPMSASLLGMPFLRRLYSFDFRGDRLILQGNESGLTGGDL